MFKLLISGSATMGVLFLLLTLSGCNDPSTYSHVISSSDPSVQSKQSLVTVAGDSQILSVSIATGDDDAEQSATTGAMNLGSSDLELIDDTDYAEGEQIVGLRFTGISIPEGAVISSAHIQFEVDEVSVVATSLSIEGENADSAAPFLDVGGNIGGRARTVASVSWNPPPWNTVNERGADQQTPDLGSIVQEIISRPNWDTNSLAFIFSGTGKRVVKSFEKGSGVATLHIEYSTDTQATTPEITSPASASTLTGTTMALEWVANTTNVTDWWLYVGSSQGAQDILDSGLLASSLSTYTVTDLPVDGRTLYVTLWYKKGGSSHWDAVEHTYIAATLAGVTPEITAPAPDSIFTETTATLEWTANMTNVSDWWLYVGSSQGAQNILDSGLLTSSASTYTVTDLPVDGRTLYVKLWYKKGGSDNWNAIEYTYTAATITGLIPEITSPEPGSTFLGDTATLDWTANTTNVSEWWLYVGSNQGARDILDSGSLTSSLSTYTVTNLPVDGRTLYVKLWYKEDDSGNWKALDYTYKAYTDPTNAGLVINEFMADNGSTLATAGGKYEDWIELKNNGNNAVSLENWCLTDDSAVLTKWCFPAVNLAAGGYLVVFASKDNITTGSELHTNFKLSKSGEYLALIKPDGTIADEYSATYPAQIADVSYGIDTSGSKRYFPAATPNAANNAGVIDLLSFTNTSISLTNTDSMVEINLATLAGSNTAYTLTTEDGNAGWLSAATSTGEDGITADQITIEANLSGLAEGTYTGTITASAEGYQSETITVTLTVGAVITSDIVINEVLAANVDTNLDPDHFEFSDWIELYNTSNQDINIGGYYLSDDPNQVNMWQIPAGTILEAGKYLLIWADKTNQGLHTNFSLSSNGEAITLAESDGTVIDSLVYEELKTDISCAKGAGGVIVYMNPTPGAVNSTHFNTLSRSKKPDFSVAEGFYGSSQTVSLTQVNGGEIYYTIDGSTPTVSSTLYSQPIIVNSTTVIRARAYEVGKIKSKVRTKTYLIGEESTLPVMSIAIDSDYLFDDTVGIHVPGTNGRASYGCYGRTDNTDLTLHRNFNQEWKRPVLIEYFEASNQKAFNLGAGISIAGQCSRYENKKSFSLELDGKYGDKSLQYSFYQSKPDVDKIKDFKLRSGSTTNDVLSTLLVTAGSFNIDYQGYQAVRVFINGEYWGVYNIREKKGKDYLKSNYPNLGEVDIIAFNLYGYDVKEGNIDAFNLLFNYINTHDLSITANYQTLLGMIDEDNYIDYMILMIYSGNVDWLWNNNRWWRERTEGAKWRWMLDDLDAAFEDPSTDTFGFIMSYDTSDLFMARLFKGLLTNSTFKQKFKDRFYAHLDSVFVPANVRSLINTTSVERRDYIEGGRWNESQGGHDNNINGLNTFADGRADYIRNQLDNL